MQTNTQLAKRKKNSCDKNQYYIIQTSQSEILLTFMSICKPWTYQITLCSLSQ